MEFKVMSVTSPLSALQSSLYLVPRLCSGMWQLSGWCQGGRRAFRHPANAEKHAGKEQLELEGDLHARWVKTVVLYERLKQNPVLERAKFARTVWKMWCSCRLIFSKHCQGWFLFFNGKKHSKAFWLRRSSPSPWELRAGCWCGRGTDETARCVIKHDEGKKGTWQRVFTALETPDKIPAPRGGVSAVRAGAEELFKIAPKQYEKLTS